MGDVVLTAPVIASMLEQNPQLEIVFLSRPFLKPFFQTHNRLTFIGANLKGKHKGVKGLYKLKKELSALHNFDAVIDLHDVLRTKLLRNYFKISKVPVFTINKARNEKKKLLKGDIPFQKLKHTTVRYLDTFKKAGLITELSSGPWLKTNEASSNAFLVKNNLVKDSKWIGIAPFAAHPSKEWGLEKIQSTIKSLLQEDHKIFLFGGGEKEIEQLKGIQLKFPETILVAGELSLEEELSLIAQLDVMLAMDSSNMHMATLVGTKVISIWGPTHHYLGFGPLENEQNIIELTKEELPCRPCTIYGKLSSKEDEMCAKKSMEMISTELVLEKITSIINAV